MDTARAFGRHDCRSSEPAGTVSSTTAPSDAEAAPEQQTALMSELLVLRQTVQEQSQQLDALFSRIVLLLNRETELLVQLADARDSARRREEGARAQLEPRVRGLEALVEERTDWAQRAVRDVEHRDVTIRELQARLERFEGGVSGRLYRAAARSARALGG